MQSGERNEEKRLDFVIQPEYGDCFIAKMHQNHIKHHNVNRIKRLHEYGWIAEYENAFGIEKEFVRCGRAAQTLYSGDDRREHLSANGGNRCTGYAHFRAAEHAENHNRVKHDIADCTRNLRNHRQGHVALRLMNLCENAFGKKSDAADAHDVSVGYGVLHRKRVAGGKVNEKPHGEERHKSKHRPHNQRYYKAAAGGFVGGIFVLFRIKTRHKRVYANACSHRKGNGNKLNRIDDGKSGQAMFGVFSYKEAVHNVVKRLNKQRQHNRRCNFKQHFANAFRSVKRRVGALAHKNTSKARVRRFFAKLRRPFCKMQSGRFCLIPKTEKSAAKQRFFSVNGYIIYE